MFLLNYSLSEIMTFERDVRNILLDSIPDCFAFVPFENTDEVLVYNITNVEDLRTIPTACLRKLIEQLKQGFMALEQAAEGYGFSRQDMAQRISALSFTINAESDGVAIIVDGDDDE